jgi:predicted dehydrogenase
MADKVRVAFIGAGGLANGVHYPSVASLPDVDLAATCDLFADKAQATAERWGIPRVYSDYRRMLEEVDPDAVYVIMPPQDLFEPASTVLQQGRHLFVEKPLCVTAHQAQMLAYFAEEHSCLTAVGFQRRHIPAVTALKRRVEERGPIQQATVSFLKSADLSQHAGHYGGVIDNLTVDGCHAVDNLRFLCGGEVEHVAAHVRTRRAPGPSPNEFTALVSFSSGAVGILNSSYATGRRIFRAEFHGPSITGYVDADRESFIVADNGEPEVYDSKEFGTAGGAPGDSPLNWKGQWHENRHFIDCIKEGRQPLTNFADAAKTMELVERIHAVGRRGSRRRPTM